MLARARAVVLGIREFRSDWTTSYDPPLIEWYDFGREMAHRATFRVFDRSAA